MALYDDLAWYESNRQWISSTYGGKYVVIKDKAVVGAYPDYASAVNAAAAMFGSENAVIKLASPTERIEYITGLGRRLRLAQARPAMAPNLAEELRRTGAIVTVVVSAPRSAQAQGPAKGTPQTVKGMVDTGASISTVKDQVATAAGLIQTGSVPLGGVGGTSERPIYAASFTLPEYGITIDPIEVGGVDLPIPGIDILIGRDLLAMATLRYQGKVGAFALLTEEEKQAEAAAAGGAPSNSTSTWLAVAAGAAVVGIGTLFALKVL